MIRALDLLISRRRLIFGMSALLAVAGLLAWRTMPRQEDPSFVPRWGSLVVPFPGADADRVERLVLDPVEDALARVPEIQEVEATARAGVAILTIRLDDTLYDTEAGWDEVRDALADAAVDLPPEAGPLDLDDGIGDPASVVVLLTGADLLTLREAALALEDHLQRIPGVSRVERVGDPGARVAVILDPATSARLSLPPSALAAQLRARNVTIPGGTLQVDDRQLVLLPRGELASVDEVARTPIVLPNGSAVPLSELATVRLEVADPPTERVHHDGAPAVGLSIVPELPQDLVAFGDRVQASLADARVPEGVDLDVFAFQPELVDQRLSELAGSLLAGIATVALVLFLAMGPRLGAVISSVVPLVALSTVAVYAAGGGVLHQISVAALVLALGLLVDNAIVVAEQVQAHLDRGLAPADAAREAVRELALPLGTATGTTVAAFTPMLLSSGGTGDFTRAIPVILILALVLSYGFALLVTPALSASWLRPSPERGETRLDRLAGVLGAMSARHPWRVLAGLGVALAITGGLVGFVEQQFFPLSDRARVIVTVELPEGTPLATTEALSADLEAELAQLPAVTGVTSFVGGGLPRFYYNLQAAPRSPQSATIVLTTTTVAEAADLLDDVRQLALDHPEATIVPKRLQQGPPVGAPVELKLQGDDLADLHQAAEAVVGVLRATEGAADVRHDLGVGLPTLAYAIDDAWTTRHGLSRADVALALLSRTRGADAGVWRGGEDPTPIVVASPDGERTSAAALPMLDVGGVPLDRLATADLAFQPAAIRHEDGRRTVLVQAELADGATFGGVRDRAAPRLAALDLPDGIDVTWAGEAEGSEEANGALLRTLPIGVGLLLFFLLIEFDSVRRVGIVLTTVPLAAVGVVPGLVISGQPFGFMSMLGTIALIGIVVNNAIVLLEVVETRRAEGADLDEALADAVRQRLRPILLTTSTTVVGMLPLAFSASSLWPPLAWAIISGLTASTALTLLAVPALYRILLGPSRLPRRLAPVLAAIGLSTPAAAAPITLDNALRLGADAPTVEIADHEADAAHRDATAAWLGATGPSVGISATAVRRDGPVEIATPFGPIAQQPESQADAGVQLRIPVLDPGALARAPAAVRAAKAADADLDRARQQGALSAGERFLDVAALEAQRDAQAAYVEALRAVVGRARDQERVGLAVPADRQRAEVALADAEQALRSLDATGVVARWALGAAVGRADAVEVAWAYTPPAPRSAEEAVAIAAGRPDLQALDRRIAALKAERSAIVAEGLPTLSVYGQQLWTDNPALVDDSWAEAGVEVSWTPLARGTRPPRVSAASARIAAARSAREALALGIGVEVRAAVAALGTALAEVEVRRAAVAQADEARRIVGERWAQDLATLTDVLQVEADARAQHVRLRVAEIDATRAWLRLRTATGEGVPVG